jgi:SAM-dependent methyltransferase
MKADGSPFKIILLFMASGYYTDEYYEEIAERSLASAKEIIPLIQKIISPKSVVDVGCGTGAWLSAWKQNDVNDITGIDGHYVNENKLMINTGNFIKADLENDLNLNRYYDLVMSLEVAEHIRPEKASVFIRSLCKLGDIILFSAAIPNQEGLLHYNEQYPKYWISKFSEFGFLPYDCIRKEIWENDLIDVNYRQNLLFFINREKTSSYPSIAGVGNNVLPLVHPLHFEHKQTVIRSYQNVLRTPFHAGWYFIKKYGKYLFSKQDNRKK